RDLSAKYSVMQGAMAALERIFALLDTPADKPQTRHSDSRGPDRTVDNAAGGAAPSAPLIEFRNVSFAYRDSENALDGLNLTIRRGDRVALVGESGGGKTTITRLLTRLYEIDDGSILVNGAD